MAEIIAGMYEDYVLGFKIDDISKNAKLEQSFAVRLHSGSVRSLATSQDGSLVMSAGFDEVVNLVSLKKRKLLNSIELAVNCAVFVDSYLICGCEDSNVYIFECKSSSITRQKTLKGHTKSVTSMSVHPSGKVLLTISKDNTMRTWNLIKGRSAFTTNVRAQAHLVCWSKSGCNFAVGVNNEVYLYGGDTGSLKHNLKVDKRLNSIEFLSDDVFILATDSSKLELFDCNSGRSVSSHEAHQVRVKGLKCIGEDISHYYVASASSDGIIKLWSYEKMAPYKAEELSQIDTGARLTCLTGCAPGDTTTTTTIKTTSRERTSTASDADESSSSSD